MQRIELKGINQSFGDKKVLEDISFVVNEGEMVSLLGPSGCGKSTTLKVIAGLLRPDKGDVIFNGTSVNDVPVEKRGAVIVFQDYLLFPHLTVEENVGFGLRMAGVNKKDRLCKSKEMIGLVQLNGNEKKYPHELSGGQRQRTALARALAVEPRVLLLDEPFSNLDQRLREDMRDFVKELQKKINITTILVTHDKEEALMLSDKVGVMIDGRIKQFGTPEEVYKSPVSSEVADFFGEKNYINGSIENGVFRCDLGDFIVDFNRNMDVKAMIRPENTDIYSVDEAYDIFGVVKRRRYAGDRVYYNVSFVGMDIKCVSSSDRLFEVGDRVRIDMDFSRAVFYPLA